MNFKLYYLHADDVKGPHESTSVEESKNLYGSRRDEDETDADRSAVNEASDSRKQKSARIKRQQAMVRVVTKGSYCMYQYNKPGHFFIRSEISWNCSFKAKINNLLWI